MAQTMCARCNSHLSHAEIRQGNILCSKCEQIWMDTVLQQFKPQLERLRATLEKAKEGQPTKLDKGVPG